SNKLQHWQMEMAVVHWQFVPIPISSEKLDILLLHFNLQVGFNNPKITLKAWWENWLQTLVKASTVSIRAISDGYLLRIINLRKEGQIDEKFALQIEALIKSEQLPESSSHDSENIPMLKLLTSFLEKGTFQREGSPKNMISKIVSEDANAFANYLKNVSKRLQQSIINRLEEWSSDESLRQLLQSGFQKSATELDDYSERLKWWLQQAGQQWKLTQHEIWIIGILVVLEFPDIKLSATSSVQPILLKVCRKKRLSIRMLKQDLSGSIITGNKKLNDFDQGILDLVTQLLPTDEEEVTKYIEHNLSTMKSSSGVDLFIVWLQSGSWPWWVTEADQKFELDQLLGELDQSDSALKNKWNNTLRKKQALNNWLEVSTEKQRFKLLDIMSGGYGDMLETTHSLLNNINAKNGKVANDKALWSAFYRAVLKIQQFSSEKFIRQLIISIAPVFKQTVETTAAQIQQSLIDNLYHQRIKEVLQVLILEGIDTTQDTSKEEELDPKSSSITPLPSPASSIDDQMALSKETDLSTSFAEDPTNSAASSTNTTTEEGDELANHLEGSQAKRELIQQQIKCLFDFIATGRMNEPWLRLSKEQVMLEAKQLLQYYPQILRKALLKLRKDQHTGPRLSILFPSTSDRWRILKLYANDQWNDFHNIYQDFDKLLPGLIPKHRAHGFEIWVFNFVFSQPTHGQQLFVEIEKYTANFIARLLETYRIQPDAWLKLAASRFEDNPGQWKILPEIWSALGTALLANGLKRTKDKQRTNIENSSTMLEEPIFIHNAGLVLTAPFLGRYFSTLKMLDDNNAFVDDITAERAIHLLQYLASGHSETSEDLLVFNKILCGMPIEFPVIAGIDLSEEEATISSQLLNSIIANWSLMNNSSIENLRGGFLIREGRLVEEEDRWVLVVENKAYDITLDSLPYTISMVKLPWMEKHIEVEWRTRE
ncbi:MAG: contractile injection system tape measure protein, partial [Bacteroidota bacterium]